ARELEPKPEAYAASVTRFPASSAAPKRVTRWARAYSRGVAPVTCLNKRWKWKGLTPTAAASRARLGADSLSARIAQAFATGVRSVGRQRLQARKPAASASAGVTWKATFFRSGIRDAQLGRQNTPVVRTE